MTVMFEIENLALFIISGIILNILPGPDSLYVIGRSARHGFLGGSLASLGIGAGTFVHIFAAAFGISAILAASAAAFTLVKIIGCLYLVYLGLTLLFAKHAGESRSLAVPEVSRGDSAWKIFSQGFLTNVLNPKVALFFLAFVPQFIAATSVHKTAAFLLLGLIFNINGMIWCHLLAWFSATVSNRIGRSKKLALWLSRAAGSLFCYFGLRLALSQNSG